MYSIQLPLFSRRVQVPSHGLLETSQSEVFGGGNNVMRLGVTTYGVTTQVVRIRNEATAS